MEHKSRACYFHSVLLGFSLLPAQMQVFFSSKSWSRHVIAKTAVFAIDSNPLGFTQCRGHQKSLMAKIITWWCWVATFSSNILMELPIRIDHKILREKVSISGRQQFFKIVHVLVDILDEWILLFNVKWATTSLTLISDVQDIWPHQCCCGQVYRVR